MSRPLCRDAVTEDESDLYDAGAKTRVVNRTANPYLGAACPSTVQAGSGSGPMEPERPEQSSPSCRDVTEDATVAALVAADASVGV